MRISDWSSDVCSSDLLAGVTGDRELSSASDELAERIDRQWDGSQLTWVDGGATASGSGRIRTLDSLLPSLLEPRPEALAQLADPGAFGAPCGPRGEIGRASCGGRVCQYV